MHFDAFWRIFRVIVKFMALPGRVAQGMTGKRMDMRLLGFSLFYMCHSVPFCAISLLSRVRAAGSRIWIVWYMRSCMSNRKRLFLEVRAGDGSSSERAIRESPLREIGGGLFSEEPLMQAVPAHRGMKMYVECGGGQPQGLPLRRVCRGLLSYQDKAVHPRIQYGAGSEPVEG